MIDKTSQFFAILTAVGEAKHANAIAMGLDWMFTEMGLGDANGTDPIPDRLQTQLIHEWRRAPINQIRVDPANPNTVITEQIIPPEVGGEWIREIGLYDVDGDLVAVANCAPSYKPLLAQGTGKTQVVRMNFIVSSSANIVLKIDPAVVLATREYVDLAISEALAKLDHKQSVRVAATAPITLSNVQTIDDVAVVIGDRVLVTAQEDAEDNGLYVVSVEGWTRAADADNSLEVTPGLFIHVEEGTANRDSLWQLVTDAPITLGTTGLQFELIAGGSGAGVGTFRSVTVDALGRVIAGTNPTTLDGYGITDALPVDGTAVAATQLETARTLSISGAASGSVLFDGTADADIELALADSGVTAGTYSSVTVNAQGVVTAGDQLTTEDLGLGTAAMADAQTQLNDATVDALMKVGAFGLGGTGIVLPADTNLDTVILGGLYRINTGGGIPAGFENCPMLVIRSGDTIAQILVSHVTGTIVSRGGYRVDVDPVPTFGAWSTSWDSNNLVKQNSPQEDITGHVLLAGAYGWGQGGIQVANGTDINTLIQAGVYRTFDGPNVPVGATNTALLVMVGADVITQLMIPNNTGTLHTRSMVMPSGVWCAWSKSWDSSNFNPAAYQPLLEYVPQPSLGFPPVQQGTGVGQLPNTLKLGWNGNGAVKVTVDASDFGELWMDGMGVEKVRGAIASFVAAEVGTYGFFIVTSTGSGVGLGPGALVDGSFLGWSNAGGTNYGSTWGTWMLVGASPNDGSQGVYRTTLCKRVA